MTDKEEDYFCPYCNNKISETEKHLQRFDEIISEYNWKSRLQWIIAKELNELNKTLKEKL